MPKMAAEWEKETPNDAALPRYVKGSPAAKKRVSVSRGLRKAFPKG
jgi:hypothetical protein